jgi:NADH-ubiquinone oxidoreductase chain 4
MLKLLLIIPILGCIPLMFIKSESTTSPISSGAAPSLVKDNKANSYLKCIALTASLINLFISILVWIQFDSLSTEYQFVEQFNLSSPLTDFHFNIGLDGISLYFVLLTTFITPICLLSNWTDITNKLKYFLISFLLLETLQIAVFVVLDLLLFYIFFESVLIPLFLIIGIWGASANRIRAAFLLFLYTLAGSLFMLLAILAIYGNVGSTDFKLLNLVEISFESQKYLWLAFFVSFAVKTPLAPFYIWLFRAHAESPLAGSILLAAVILKLATYGYLRVLISILPDATQYFSPLVQTIAIITLVYSSLATIRQIDTKGYVAYSSIGHMSVVVLGLFSNTIQGIEGAILLSVAHGLFICVGGVLYSRYHTRLISYYRGMVLNMPVFTSLFLCFTLFNAAIPLSLNWAGEFLSLAGIFQKSPFVGIIGASTIVLSAIYSIWLYNRISYGEFSKHLKITKDINRREFMLLLPLLIGVVALGIYPNVILDTLHVSVTTLLYSLPVA